MFPNQVPPTEPPAVVEPTEFVADPDKSAEENEAAKAAFEAAKPKTEPTAPEPLTKEAIKIPEGMEADEPALAKLVDILNDDKLAPGDRANALVNLQAEVAKSWSEKATAAWEDFNAQMVEETRADPVVGGPKLEANLSAISTLINTHGSPELRQVFDTSGAGNSVHVVKFLTKIAGLLSEGSPLAGSPAAAPKTQAQTLYPTMKG